MLIVRIVGGLGNQMYGYALYRALLERGRNVIMDLHFFRQKRSPILDKREFELERVFKVGGRYLTPFQDFFVDKARRLHLINLYKDRNHEGDFFPEMLNHEKGIYDGYWQSFKYISGIEDKIREAFTFRQDINEKSQAVLNKIRSCNSVSVSVRRGDFVNLKWELPMSYYTNAIKYIRERVPNAKFFFTSDDINWCIKNFDNDDDFEFVENEDPDNRFDLCVISECKHAILANSTFAMWGAWLNQNSNKIIIRPDFWSERKDFWPEDWICFKF